MAELLLNIRSVMERTNLSRSAVYRAMKYEPQKNGLMPLPAPLRISPQRVAWRASDIDRWMEHLPEKQQAASEDTA